MAGCVCLLDEQVSGSCGDLKHLNVTFVGMWGEKTNERREITGVQTRHGGPWPQRQLQKSQCFMGLDYPPRKAAKGQGARDTQLPHSPKKQGRGGLSKPLSSNTYLRRTVCTYILASSALNPHLGPHSPPPTLGPGSSCPDLSSSTTSPFQRVMNPDREHKNKHPMSTKKVL